MKTIQQRAVEYTAMRRDYQLMQDAYIAGASSIMLELKTVLSVSEEQYLRDNLEKMIKFLEGEK